MGAAEKTERTPRVSADKLNIEAMRKAATHFGVKYGTKTSAAVLAVRLEDEFSKPEFAESMADCTGDTGCGGGSPDTYTDCCPFCGLGEEKPEGVSEQSGMLAAPPSAPTNVIQLSKEAKKQKAAKLAEATVDRSTVEGAATDQTMVVASTAEIAKSPGEDRLDQDVADVKRLQNAAADSHWQLGRKLTDIEASASWKARRNAEGGQRHPTFGDFCQAELKVTAGTARNWIDFSKKYSADDIASIGTKLTYVIRAPEVDQPRLLGMAREGAARTELQAELAQSKARHREETGEEHRRETGRDAQTSAAGAKREEKILDRGKPVTATPATSRITIATPLDKRHNVNLEFKAQGSKEWIPALPKHLKAGQKVAGKIEMPGTIDAHVVVHLHPTTGQMVASIMFKKRSE